MWGMKLGGFSEEKDVQQTNKRGLDWGSSHMVFATHL
jgi:hypothetical protein